MDLGYVYDDINPCFRGESYVKDFEIFALDNRTGIFELKQLATKHDVQLYVNEQPHIRSNSSQILISRHKDHLSREIRPSFPSYSPDIIKLLEEQWHIPSTYRQLRTYANACGIFQRYVKRNQEGEIDELSFVIRVPHSPRRIKSIWSVAVSWTAKSAVTLALFDGAADADMDALKAYLNARPQLQSHPLAIPAILMDILGRYKMMQRNEAERILFDLEIKLGLTRGSSTFPAPAAQHLSHELDRNIFRCNQLMTSITYLERSQVFIRDLGESLRHELCRECSFDPSVGRDTTLKFTTASSDILDVVENCHNLAVNTLHQIKCLEKRAQALLSVTYIIIAQKDNRLSIEIATAAKQDSSIVTAIGFVTMVFLPATFVTSLFGMNYFDLDAQSRTLVVSNSFWLYWAISLSLTFAVLLTFLAWMTWSQSFKRTKQQQQPVLTPPPTPTPDPRAKLLAGLQPIPESAGPCYPLMHLK